MSPVTVGLDAAGRALIASRETTYTVRNLRRDPHAVLCVFVEACTGPWVQIEGTAEVVTLPEALAPLVDYYRRLAGEHPDWDDYRRAMTADRRALIRITIERAGPDRQGEGDGRSEAWSPQPCCACVAPVFPPRPYRVDTVCGLLWYDTPDHGGPREEPRAIRD
jgi:PPOX class probable F420-dependent enzyme